MGPKTGASAADDALKDLLPDEEDLLYEEELLRNPYNLKMWLRYLDARKNAPSRKRHVLYERALQALPGSYKVRRSRERATPFLGASEHLSLITAAAHRRSPPSPLCSCGTPTSWSAATRCALSPSCTPTTPR